MHDFTQRKFLALPIQKQHKQCIEVLRRLYDLLINQESFAVERDLYCQWLSWMKEPIPSSFSLEQVSDLYHAHLQKASICKKEHGLLPEVRKGDKKQGEKSWPIAVYLDNLRSAHNVGSIIRTIEAFSLGSLYFSPQTPFITQKKVLDTAMGASEWVLCSQKVELIDLPRPIIAMETSDNAISLYEMIFPNSFTLVIGNEEYGCSEKTLREADVLIEIPLRGHKNSLNVANAFAIAAGEISRQKGNICQRKI